MVCCLNRYMLYSPGEFCCRSVKRGRMDSLVILSCFVFIAFSCLETLYLWCCILEVSILAPLDSVWLHQALVQVKIP